MPVLKSSQLYVVCVLCELRLFVCGLPVSCVSVHFVNACGGPSLCLRYVDFYVLTIVVFANQLN